MTDRMGERGRQGAAPLGGHTPGPWTVPLDGEGRVRGGNDEWLFYVEDYGNGVPDPERCEADARLIAAAPELLEALQGLLDWNDHKVHDSDFFWDRARAALAKARGEQ